VSENEIDVVRQKQKIVTLVKVGMFVLTGFVVAPAIFVAIKGMVGLAVAAVAGLFMINVTPAIADAFANWRLKLIKAEAGRNPIETLQIDFGKRQDALHRFKDAINTFSASVMNFSDKLEGFRVQFPQDSEKFDSQLAKMKKLLEIRRNRYKEAEAAVKQYAAEIDRAKAIWDMGLEAAKMNAAAGMTEEDFMQKIKVETALDSVTKSMNSAFAELETSLEEEEGDKPMINGKPLELSGPSGQVIDAIPVKRKSHEKS
jgi:hypothetical protein